MFRKESAWKYAWSLALFAYFTITGYGFIANFADLRYMDFIIWLVVGANLLYFSTKPIDRKFKVYLIWFLSLLMFTVLVALVFEDIQRSSYFVDQARDLLVASQFVGRLALISPVVVAFFGIILAIYVLFKITFSRPRRMKKLAEQYGFQYSKGTPLFEWGLGSKILKRNVLEASIKGRKVMIRDVIDKEGYPAGALIGSLTRRATEIHIDGKTEECRGKIYGLCPLDKVERILREVRGRA